MSKKSKTLRYQSEALAAIHETAEGLYETGVINKQTLRRFDDTCLTPVEELSGEEIRAIREHEQVSQTVFAHYLNVSKTSVSQWECGKKKPHGSSLKLLSLVKKKGLAAVT